MADTFLPPAPHTDASARRRRPGLGVAALYVPTLLIVVTLVFALPRTMPGDPLSVFDDPDSNVFVSDDESRQRLLSYYGLDEPLPAQYLDYLSRVVRGDLGWSISRNTPVSTLVRQHLPWTLLLMGTSLALAALLSFLAGIAAAWRLAQKQLTTLDVGQRRQEVVKLQQMVATDLPVLSLYVPDRLMIYRKGGFENWYFTPGCSPCGATGNKHMLVTGRKVGFAKGGER